MSENTAPEDDAPEGSTTIETAPKTKRSWGLIALYFVVAVMMVMALSGLFMALTGKATDPASIKPPTHTEEEMAKFTPIILPTEIPPKEIVPVEETKEVAPVKQKPEIQQKETPLKLEEIKEKILIEKEPVAPQSLILWDEPAHKAVLPKGHRPQIVIVIDDMGLNMRNSREMAQLKYPTTLAYMPYAQNLLQQTKAAYDNGHELIVHMPMEPEDIAHNNPGPDALLTTVSAEENRTRLQRSLGKFDRYIIGLNNHMGSKMTASEKSMRPVMQMVKDKGLWFLDSRTIGNSVAGKLADEYKIPYVARDIFLDNTETVPAILIQLKQLEAMAKKRGYAVAIGHPYNSTLAALKEWMPNARAKGFDLVPLSVVIAQRFPAAPVPKYARVEQKISLAQHD